MSMIKSAGDEHSRKCGLKAGWGSAVGWWLREVEVREERHDNLASIFVTSWHPWQLLNCIIETKRGLCKGEERVHIRILVRTAFSKGRES